MALDLVLESETARGETTLRVLCCAGHLEDAAAAIFWPNSSDEDRAIPGAAALLLKELLLALLLEELVRPGTAATRLAGDARRAMRGVVGRNSGSQGAGSGATRLLLRGDASYLRGATENRTVSGNGRGQRTCV